MPQFEPEVSDVIYAPVTLCLSWRQLKALATILNVNEAAHQELAEAVQEEIANRAA